MNLTLTRVVFESINAIAIPNDNDDLTLTSVVFELNPSASKPICLNYLTLTIVVQKNKSCNKENFSMLQLFLLIL